MAESREGETTVQRQAQVTQAESPNRAAARGHPLVIVLAAVAAGIVADRYQPLPPTVWWACAMVGVSLWSLFLRRRHEMLGTIAIVLATAALGAAWHHHRWRLSAADDLGCFAREAAQPACVEVIALETPRPMPRLAPDPMRVTQLEEQTRVEVEVLGIRNGAAWRPASGRARLTVQGLLPEVQAGDRLRVFAQLTTPPHPRNPGEFDVAAYLRAEGVRGQLRAQFAESIQILQSASPWQPRRLLEQVRTRGNGIFAAHLDQRLSALASAVLLGTREQLDQERTAAFLETGSIHLLSISGLHVGVLAAALLFVLHRMLIPRAWVWPVVAAFIVFYTLMVDAEPPVVRAMVLVLVTCVAAMLGRRRQGFNALACAALVVLAINPADLFRTGAQLSFLCVAALMAIAARWQRHEERDPLERLIEENRAWPERLARWLGREAWHLTAAGTVLWLLTLPLVMARFNLLTPAAVVVNLLVWLPMTAALVSGFALLVVGAVFPPLAPLCAAACNWSFGLLEWFVELGQRVPWGHLWVPGPDDWWLAGFYGALVLLAAFPRLRPPRRWCVAMLAAWSAAGFVPAWMRTDPQQLRCAFLAVGHGQAVVLELPTGQTLLYDAGRMSAPLSAARSTAGYLWSRGLTHIDAVVLSHGDVDHYNALPELLDRFSVGAVYVSPVMFDVESPALTALREAIARHGVPLRELSAGDRLTGTAACTIETLHPPPRGMIGSDNANSVVLSVECHGHRILLTGDLDSPGLDDVVAEPPFPCDVVLVPHHGSQSGNPAMLAEWCTARWAVISGSHRWDTRPVERIYEKSGSRVLHTADCGAVTVVVRPEGVTVEEFR